MERVPQRTRLLALVAIAMVCIAVTAIVIVIAASSNEGTASDAEVEVAEVGRGGPRIRDGVLLARAVDEDDPGLNGKVTLPRFTTGRRPRVFDLACERVHMSAGRGVCLALTRLGDYEAVVFDRGFRPRVHLGFDGLPSRTRVAPNGQVASVTAFVTGHSYAVPGRFSTATKLLDLRRGKWLGNLEEFDAFRDGEPITERDRNFWGVTFARDSRRFYATLSTGSHRYLVRGDARARRIDVVGENDKVECPSLSPDQTRVAYKRTLGGGRWRLHMLDLRTGADKPLAEKRSIDDQVEWLDDDWVTYGDGRDVWAVRADGGGPPRRLLHNAASPTALRTATSS